MTEKHVRFEMFATRHCLKIARSFFIGTPNKTIGSIEHCMHSKFFGKPNAIMEATITCCSLSHDWCLEIHFVQINSFLYKRIDGEKIIFSSILLWKRIASRQQRALTCGCCFVHMLRLFHTIRTRALCLAYTQINIQLATMRRQEDSAKSFL